MSLFDWNQIEAGVLIIDTTLMKLKFDRGAIIYIQDKASSEVLLNTSYSAYKTALEGNTDPYSHTFRNFIGFNSWDDPYNGSSNQHERGCSNSYVTTPTPDDANNFKLLFSPCVDIDDSLLTSTSVQYDFDHDSDTGEVFITLTGIDNAGAYPHHANLPIPFFAGVSSLFNSQELPLAADTQGWENIGVGGGVAGGSVPLVIGRGTNSCFGIWSEKDVCVQVGLTLFHTKDTYDIYVFKDPFDPKEHAATPTTITGGPWRITTQANWMEIARRWKARYLIYTSPYGKYLWENPIEWVRTIHCIFGQPGADYATLASELGDPNFNNKILAGVGAMRYNGNQPWILFGQITPRALNSYPTDAEITSMNANGYHPLHYIFPTVLQTTDRDVTDGTTTYDFTHGLLNRQIGLGIIPEGWDYTIDPLSIPDFAGWTSEGTKNWADWKTYWSSVPQVPHSDSYAHIIHAGSQKYKDSLIPGWKAFCDLWGYAGGFWDTLSAYREFPEADAVVNGEDFQTGVRSALRWCQAEGLVTLYEYFDINVLPYCWYGYEGYWIYETYWTDTAPSSTYVNHPLRTALIGSFHWSNEVIDMDYPNFRFDLAAYLGTLPEFVTVAGWATFKARAKLFCKFELFNDLPDHAWGDTTTNLAYYRSNTENIFRFEDRGSGVYAYVEEHWQGDYDRLVIDDGVVTTDNIDEELPSILYSRYNYAVLPSDDADLTTIYSTEDIADVAADDTDMVPQLATSQIAIHQFKQQINGTGGIINVVAQVTIPCSTSTAYLQIYNRSGTPAWDTIDSDNATGANTDFTLSATVTDLTDYKDANDIVACRVYQEMQ